jgi:hypothetical protein
MKRPSRMGFAMQQMWIPGAFALEKDDDIFQPVVPLGVDLRSKAFQMYKQTEIARCSYFKDRLETAAAILSAVQNCERVIREELV